MHILAQVVLLSLVLPLVSGRKCWMNVKYYIQNLLDQTHDTSHPQTGLRTSSLGIGTFQGRVPARTSAGPAGTARRSILTTTPKVVSLPTRRNPSLSAVKDTLITVETATRCVRADARMDAAPDRTSVLATRDTSKCGMSADHSVQTARTDAVLHRMSVSVTRDFGKIPTRLVFQAVRMIVSADCATAMEAVSAQRSNSSIRNCWNLVFAMEQFAQEGATSLVRMDTAREEIAVNVTTDINYLELIPSPALLCVIRALSIALEESVWHRIPVFAKLATN